MAKQEMNFFDKKGIRFSEVMYLTRDGRKTVIHLVDGSAVETFEPMKSLVEGFPKGAFEGINKGVIVAPGYIDEIVGNTYHMKDGTTFEGRVRTTKKQREQMMQYTASSQAEEWEQFAIIDKLPLAFCIIELVFNENGHGIDFIFRYCNKEMEALEGKTIHEMLDKSFYEVFENGDKKWLVTYADVALNGGTKILESYSPEIGSNLRIYCFQPKPNFCGCALIRI